jgi:hypothetical protein
LVEGLAEANGAGLETDATGADDCAGDVAVGKGVSVGIGVPVLVAQATNKRPVMMVNETRARSGETEINRGLRGGSVMRAE